MLELFDFCDQCHARVVYRGDNLDSHIVFSDSQKMSFNPKTVDYVDLFRRIEFWYNKITRDILDDFAKGKSQLYFPV